MYGMNLVKHEIHKLKYLNSSSETANESVRLLNTSGTNQKKSKIFRIGKNKQNNYKIGYKIAINWECYTL